MKYFGIITLLVVLLLPVISFGDTVRIINNVSEGKDGESVSSTAKGQDGTDGEDGVVIQGKSTSHVDVYTEINGKVIEDSHTVVTDEDPLYEQTRVYEKDGVKSETTVKVNVTSNLQDKKSVKDAVSEVATITNQHITENADTAVTAEAVTKADTQEEPLFERAVEQLGRIFSDIYSYVSNIFTSSGESPQQHA